MSTLKLSCPAGGGNASAPFVIVTSDGSQLSVDKDLLRGTSRVFADLLADCDTSQLRVEETRTAMEGLLAVMHGQPLPDNFDYSSLWVYDKCKSILSVADKYDMPLVKERCEKWLLYRLLRLYAEGKPPNLGLIRNYEWLALSQKYGMQELGRFTALKLGEQLSTGSWTDQLRECVARVPDAGLTSESLSLILQGATKRKA